MKHYTGALVLAASIVLPLTTLAQEGADSWQHAVAGAKPASPRLQATRSTRPNRPADASPR